MASGYRPASSRRVRIAALAAVVLLCGSLWFLSQHPGNGASLAAADRSVAQAPMELAASDIATVKRRTLVRKLPLSGTLKPLVQSEIRSRVSGEVLEVSVREGQSVRAGEVLVRIDTRSQQALVASQRAALDKARADLSIASLNYENSQRLLEKQFIAQNVLDTSKSVYDAAAAGVKLAEAQLRLAEIGLQDAEVRAPFDAVVSRRIAEPGEQISSDALLLELVDLRHMELQAAAPAAEIPVLKPGQIARIRVDGYGERVFEARLERINPNAEQGSRLILLYLSIDNSDAALRGGMFAQGSLLIEQAQAALAIPATAVLNDAGLDYVMVIENGVVQRRAVHIGMHAANDNLVEVLDGLTEGEQVLAVDLASLEPGTAVQLTSALPPD
ncbi:MAG: efflux RND transporter periplasmic adaptor subunit [Gammaproteobacteria bacterium]|nr:efflux RND transporter periplasmic adaptor subunit [Gammaproteobacteria bacterium]MBP6050833.1 efflux RND transporter periplasmic adaptor subunit [Pseudomonadales bacterium]MBK6584379.1 efflux RND transporter periplasmic adaptor subunit [Gammaproteobacteria bacterium]MBK7520839.1 efflux RND transporter periplasmic adaptor subunit [Gammaproteobacteria bacterium]MBK7727916.1 efflux RND transporter periplasmic adaptor subunit [Gammaproteobacteria bacterium]